MKQQNENGMTLSKMRWLLFLMGMFKIPMIAYLKPRLLELDDQVARVRIRLRRRSKNHLNSMYFGALAVGADVAAGLHAFYFAGKSGKKVSFAFKSVKAEFLKRATSSVVFESTDGPVVEQAIQEAMDSGERVNKMVIVQALNTDGECVATFEMEISVKII
jgi:acyl-coenzyme A thioesterase PaaI-like protein